MLPVWESREYTYRDYETWDESERIELVDGVPYSYGTPWPKEHIVPPTLHQTILGNLLMQFYCMKGTNGCSIYHGPLCLRLNPQEDKSDITVLEPDFLVVTDPANLNAMGCSGVPYLVAEIIMNETAKMDRCIKFNKYLQSEVPLYLVVDPYARCLQVFTYHNGKYLCDAYGDTGTITVVIAEQRIQLNFGKVFED